jgi:uncharacterized protein YggE
VNLGNIVRIDDQVEPIRPASYNMAMATRAAAQQAPTPVSAGDVGIEANVTLTVAIR